MRKRLGAVPLCKYHKLSNNFYIFLRKGLDNVTISNYNIITVEDMIRNVSDIPRLSWRQAKDKTESSLAKSVVQIETTEADSTKSRSWSPS